MKWSEEEERSLLSLYESKRRGEVNFSAVAEEAVTTGLVRRREIRAVTRKLRRLLGYYAELDPGVRKKKVETRNQRIIEEVRKNPGIEPRDLAERFGISSSLVSRICRDAEVFFTRGTLSTEEREKVRKLLNTQQWSVYILASGGINVTYRVLAKSNGIRLHTKPATRIVWSEHGHTRTSARKLRDHICRLSEEGKEKLIQGRRDRLSD